jgi:hypothetical protein
MSVLTKYTVEDWILFLTPVLSAAAGFNFGGILPGTSGFLLGVVIASLAKSLIGLGQNPSFKGNYEDYLNLIITFLGLLATAITANQQFVIYGAVIGLIAKALPSMTGGVNLEDILLTIGAIIAGVGQASGYPTIASVGLLLAVIGKSLPSSAPAPAPAPAPATMK